MNYSKKSLLFWAIILFLAFLLRFYKLDLNPVGLSHDDELNNLINAKSLALTFSHTPGIISGILTQNDSCGSYDCIYGELEALAQAPWMRFVPLDMVLSKMPFILASVGLVFFTGKLFENLSKNKTVGIVAGLFVAINPWAIYYGRTAYSYTFCFLFYIIATYFFTRRKSFKSNLILGSISALLASLFYFGVKPILPLIILWGIICNLLEFKFHYIKFTFLFTLIISIIIGSYFLILFNSYAGRRILEVGTSTTSTASTPYVQNGSIMANLNLRIERFLGFFSPASLFLTGQSPSDNYYLSGHGYFYLIDFVFLIFGIMAISHNLRKGIFILFLVTIAVIPAAIKVSETSIYSLRSGAAYPLLIGLSGWGCYFCWDKTSKLKDKHKLAQKLQINKIFILLLMFILSLSLLNFLKIYWNSPFLQSIHWFFYDRELANYISRLRNTSKKKVLVISLRTRAIFNSYVFYSNVYDNSTQIKEINNKYLQRVYEYNGVSFIDDCNKITKEDLANSTIFVDQINKAGCNIDQKNTPKIANPLDSGGIYNIVNDSLCTNYPQNRYPIPRSIYDFKLENLSNVDFCRIWITNPDNR